MLTCGFEEPEPDGENRESFPHRARLADLSPLLDQVKALPNNQVAVFRDHVITHADVTALEPSNWLPDTTIAFVYEYLSSMCIARDTPLKILLLKPSLTYFVLHTAVLEDVSTVIPALLTSQFIFLPLNDNQDVAASNGGKHWSLLVVCMSNKKALHYDSLNRHNKRAATAITQRLSHILKSVAPSGLQLTEIDTPQQTNSSDCGVIIGEISALLIRRLLRAQPGHRLSMGLGGTSFSVAAGRTLLLTLILEIYNERVSHLPMPAVPAKSPS